MKRFLIFLYGLLAYSLFLVAILYLIGFLNNFIVPKEIDSGQESSLLMTLVVDLGLITLFGLVHSLMARKWFKAWWTQIIPKAAERSTFILQASLLSLLVMWQWRPLPGTLWSLENDTARTAILVLHGLGWVMVFLSTFLINHFHFSGLQQVFENLRGKKESPQKFVTPFLYKLVRHPLLLGLLIAFWATPDLTVSHLLFAAAMGAYIFIGLHFEERDLVEDFGQEYIDYRENTPKIIPGVNLGKLAQTGSLDQSPQL